jgi:hypothetical protein
MLHGELRDGRETAAIAGLSVVRQVRYLPGFLAPPLNGRKS